MHHPHNFGCSRINDSLIKLGDGSKAPSIDTGVVKTTGVSVHSPIENIETVLSSLRMSMELDQFEVTVALELTTTKPIPYRECKGDMPVIEKLRMKGLGAASDKEETVGEAAPMGHKGKLGPRGVCVKIKGRPQAATY